MWLYINSNIDPGKKIEKGKYETNLLSLCLCKKEDLKKPVGYPCTNATIQPWVEIKKCCTEGAGMGLFAKRRFMPDDIITVYFAPKKTRKESKWKTYTIHRFGFYYSIKNHNFPLFMGAHYMSDEIWRCKEANKKIDNK